MDKIHKETGRFRQLWIFFKKGKNEINFLMNIYQTLILIFSMSFIGNMPLRVILLGTLIFAISFMIMAILIGRYTAKKVDPSGHFVSPYAQTEIQYRIYLLQGLAWLAYDTPMSNDKARNSFLKAVIINKKWLKDD